MALTSVEAVARFGGDGEPWPALSEAVAAGILAINGGGFCSNTACRVSQWPVSRATGGNGDRLQNAALEPESERGNRHEMRDA